MSEPIGPAHDHTSNVNELSDTVRTLKISDEISIFRQAGGCMEIWHIEPETNHQDIIHVCDDSDFDNLIKGLFAVYNRVPKKW